MSTNLQSFDTFLVRRGAGKTVISVSPKYVRVTIATIVLVFSAFPCGVGSIGGFVVASIGGWHVGLAGVAIFLLFTLCCATLCAICCVCYRHDSRVSLIAESTGRLRHGKRDLCAAGEIGRLVIKRQRDNSEGVTSYSYRLFVERTSGRRIKLPTLFFEFDDREEADWLAGELGHALGVKVVADNSDRRTRPRERYRSVAEKHPEEPDQSGKHTRTANAETEDRPEPEG